VSFRFSWRNRLFAGLWFGKGKSHFPTFLRPFTQSIRKLYVEGTVHVHCIVKLLITILQSSTVKQPVPFKAKKVANKLNKIFCCVGQNTVIVKKIQSLAKECNCDLIYNHLLCHGAMD